MTDEQIKEGFFKQYNKEMSQKDLDAYKVLAKRFECEDADSFQEGFNKILISVKIRMNEKKLK